MQFVGPCKLDPSSHFGCFVGWEDMLGGGGVGACYVHMAANASFTNSHQMMDSDKMGMNHHIKVSKNLLDVLHSYFGVDEICQIRQKCTTALLPFYFFPQKIVTVRSFTFLGFIFPLVL